LEERRDVEVNGLATSLAVMLTATTYQPAENVTTDEVDLIEVNHFHDEHGRLVFDQVIFYDWSTVDCRYQVCAWRLLKTPAQIPYRHWSREGFVTTWHDGDVLRRVCGKSFRETWTQFDPELVERDFLPKDRRRELRKPISSLCRLK
jgi:hypothetical protein